MIKCGYLPPLPNSQYSVCDIIKVFSLAAGINRHSMTVKPTVVLRAVLVGGVAVCAKLAGAMKAAGGVKLGAAAAAMSMAAAAMTQSKDDPKLDPMLDPKAVTNQPSK